MIKYAQIKTERRPKSMPEIKVKIDPITHEKLKKFAENDERSLSKYLERGLKYLSNIPNGYHKTPIEKLAQSLTLEQLLEQLKEAGIKDFKFNKPENPDKQLLAQQKLELTQQKLDLEKEKIKNKRSNFLKEQSEKILGYPLPYLTDQYITDYVLNEYPTNEEITAYLTKLQEEGYEVKDSYKYSQEISEYEEAIAITDEYKKIKAYCIAHGLSHDLLDLLQYPSSIQIENYDELIKSALGTPLDHVYSEEELNALAACFKPKEA